MIHVQHEINNCVLFNSFYVSAIIRVSIINIPIIPFIYKISYNFFYQAYNVPVSVTNDFCGYECDNCGYGGFGGWGGLSS